MVNLKRILWHLLGGTRGGPLRIRILQAILDRPYNTNQLAVVLGHDYKTIQHHLRVLTENRLVDLRGAGYGATYFPSADLEDSLDEFRAIVARLGAPPPAPPSVPAPPAPPAGASPRTAPGSPGPSSPKSPEPDVKP